MSDLSVEMRVKQKKEKDKKLSLIKEELKKMGAREDTIDRLDKTRFESSDIKKIYRWCKVIEFREAAKLKIKNLEK